MSTIKKVTMKSSVEDIKNFLGATASSVKKKDKNLFSRMEYTSKAMQKGEKVTKRDLFDLASDVMNLLATPVAAEEKTSSKKQTEAKPKSENALKKSGTPKKTTKDTDNESTEDTKKTSKKSAKADEPKEKKPDKKEVLNIREQILGFPEKYERDGNKYEKASDIKTIKDLYKALEKGEEFVFANVYTERMLIQIPYWGGLLEAPKKFEDDLDLAALMYVSDDLKVAYAVSTTTDGLYSYFPQDFKQHDTLKGSRFCNTMEFEIYRVVESADKEESEE